MLPQRPGAASFSRVLGGRRRRNSRQVILMARPGLVLPDWLTLALRQVCHPRYVKVDPDASDPDRSVNGGDRDVIAVPIEGHAFLHRYFLRCPTLFEPDSSDSGRAAGAGIHRG